MNGGFLVSQTIEVTIAKRADSDFFSSGGRPHDRYFVKALFLDRVKSVIIWIAFKGALFYFNTSLFLHPPFLNIFVSFCEFIIEVFHFFEAIKAISFSVASPIPFKTWWLK